MDRDSRGLARDNGASSLGNLIANYTRRGVEFDLHRMEGQVVNSVQERQYYHGIRVDMEDRLEYLAWKTGAGYKQWLQMDCRRLENEGSYSEYNIWVDKELERVERDMALDIIKEESIKEENVKQEFIKEEVIKEENIKEENIKEENIKEENIKEENIKEENIKEENIKEENIKEENIKEENIKEEFVNKEFIEEVFIKSET
ncbi:hypothetical protein NHQ30_009650 [Ciborinia camelliae]|nr:hypothetical protein NHQ30_009650 [Ciborinia camelliae]